MSDERKPVPGNEHYTVNAAGEIFNKRGFKMKNRADYRGQVRIKLIDNYHATNYIVARIVAQKFRPDIDIGHEIDYIDGDKTNVHASNLKQSKRMLRGFKKE